MTHLFYMLVILINFISLTSPVGSHRHIQIQQMVGYARAMHWRARVRAVRVFVSSTFHVRRRRLVEPDLAAHVFVPQKRLRYVWNHVVIVRYPCDVHIELLEVLREPLVPHARGTKCDQIGYQERRLGIQQIKCRERRERAAQRVASDQQSTSIVLGHHIVQDRSHIDAQRRVKRVHAVFHAHVRVPVRRLLPYLYIVDPVLDVR